MFASVDTNNNAPYMVLECRADYPTAGGMVEPVGGMVTIDTAISQLLVFVNGGWEYTLLAASGEREEIFTCVVVDNVFRSGNVTVTVEIVDDFPVACDDAVEVCDAGGEAHLSGNVMRNDDYTSADRPTNVTEFEYMSSGGSASAGVVFDNCTAVTTYLGAALRVCSDGQWTYDANLRYLAGEPFDNFTYTITDSDGSNSTAVQPIECEYKSLSESQSESDSASVVAVSVPGSTLLPVWPFITAGLVVAIVAVVASNSVSVAMLSSNAANMTRAAVFYGAPFSSASLLAASFS